MIADRQTHTGTQTRSSQYSAFLSGGGRSNWRMMRCYAYLPQAVVELRQYSRLAEHFPAKTVLVVGAYPLAQRRRQFPIGGIFLHLFALKNTSISSTGIYTVSQKSEPLNILQQPPQTCTDLNEILHTQDDIYFCHRHQIS